MAENAAMRLRLVSVTGEKLDTEVYAVELPSEAGLMTVMPGHEPVVTVLTAGVIAVRKKMGDLDAKREFLAINGAIAQIEHDGVVVLADEAELAGEIVEQEVKAAYARAQQAVAEAKDRIELEEAKRLVSHQAARLRVAELRRQRSGQS